MEGVQKETSETHHSVATTSTSDIQLKSGIHVVVDSADPFMVYVISTLIDCHFDSLATRYCDRLEDSTILWSVTSSKIL